MLVDSENGQIAYQTCCWDQKECVKYFLVVNTFPDMQSNKTGHALRFVLGNSG